MPIDKYTRTDIKPIRFEIRLKNNRIYRAFTELGYSSAKACADAFSLNYDYLIGFLRMDRSPIDRKTGGWSVQALKIADALGQCPEDLWPADVLLVRKNFKVIETTMEELAQTSAVLGPIEAATQKELERRCGEVLETLTDKEKKILKLRYWDDKTSIESGNELPNSVSGSRARQIEDKALRKLRHPALSKKLKPFLDDSDDSEDYIKATSVLGRSRTIPRGSGAREVIPGTPTVRSKGELFVYWYLCDKCNGEFWTIENRNKKVPRHGHTFACAEEGKPLLLKSSYRVSLEINPVPFDQRIERRARRR